MSLLARLPNPFGPGLTGTGRVNIRNLNRRNRFGAYKLIRDRCRAYYLGDQQSLCYVLGRYKMYVSTRDVGLSSHLMTDGCWEMWLTEAMVAAIKPGMTVVDCGANLGYYTMIAAELVGPKGAVHAFEPNASLTALMRKTLAINGLDNVVTIHEVALGDAPGEVVLAIPPGEPKNGHQIDRALVGRHKDFEIIRAPARRLDQVLGAKPVDVVKIDVEGAEQRLWDGMSGVLSRPGHLRIFLEFAADRYGDPAAFLDRILSFGFKLEVLDVKRGPAAATREQVLRRPGNVDILLVLSR